MITDYTNHFICQYKIGLAQRREFIKIHYSRFSLLLVEKFYNFGLIGSFLVKKPWIIVSNLRKNITLTQCSRPGNRQYVTYRWLQSQGSSPDLFLLQTNKGLLLSTELRMLNYRVGGELVCRISFTKVRNNNSWLFNEKRTY